MMSQSSKNFTNEWVKITSADLWWSSEVEHLFSAHGALGSMVLCPTLKYNCTPWSQKTKNKNKKFKHSWGFLVMDILFLFTINPSGLYNKLYQLYFFVTMIGHNIREESFILAHSFGGFHFSMEGRCGTASHIPAVGVCGGCSHHNKAGKREYNMSPRQLWPSRITSSLSVSASQALYPKGPQSPKNSITNLRTAFKYTSLWVHFRVKPTQA